MKVIWYLFDSALGSGKEAYTKWDKKDNYEWYSIGLDLNKSNSKHFINCDLSLKQKTINNLDKLIDTGTLKKPDYILSSPPCESWSIADTPLQAFNIKDLSKKPLEVFAKDIIRAKRKNLKTDLASIKKYYDKKQNKWKIGKNCICTTKMIIDYYKPTFWFVENGATSYIWRYMEKTLKWDFIKNTTYYNNYDWDFPKMTTFASNKYFKLKKVKIKGNKVLKRGVMNAFMGDYNEKSKIPAKLLLVIYDYMIQDKRYFLTEDINL